MKNTEIVAKIRETLSTKGWCKNILEDKQGAMCLAGALNHVLTGTSDFWLEPFEMEAAGLNMRQVDDDRIRFFRAVEMALNGGPPGIWSYSRQSLVEFNNAEETTLKDIFKVLDQVTDDD